jgi:hypothetical protein
VTHTTVAHSFNVLVVHLVTMTMLMVHVLYFVLLMHMIMSMTVVVLNVIHIVLVVWSCFVHFFVVFH